MMPIKALRMRKTGGGGGGGGSDPNRAFRTLILPVTEDPALDYSPLARTLTPHGGLTISTSDPTFPAGVGVFSGSSQYWTVPHNSLDNFGTNAVMTIEGWAYTTAYPVSGVRLLLSTRAATGSDNGILITIDQFGVLTLTSFAAASTQLSFNGAGVCPLSTWFHWAFAFNGLSGGQAFVAGAQTSVVGTALSPGNTNGDLWIGTSSNETGSSPGGTRDWLGMQTMVRISNGVCEYTGGFTPPTSYPLS